MPKNTAQNEFVDLYALLDLPFEAEADQIRKRISALYLEAQKNLDHRDRRKRLQYQQMYEVYLPQARHLLLDEAHRAEYDHYLQAFLSGQVAAPRPQPQPARRSEPELPETSSAAATEPEELPHLTEAEQAEVWAKWKQGLQSTLSEETPTAEPEINEPATTQSQAIEPEPVQPESVASAPASSLAPPVPPTASPTAAASPQPSTPTAPRPVAPRPAPRIVRPQSVASPTSAPVQEMQEQIDPEVVAAQREQTRLRIIDEEIKTAAVMGRIIGGIVAFVLGSVLVLGLDIYLAAQESYPLGIPRTVFNGIMLVLVFVVAVVVSQFTAQNARYKKDMEMAGLTYEELRRRQTS